MPQTISSSRNWRKTEEKSSSARYTAIVLVAIAGIVALIFFIISLLPPKISEPGLYIVGVDEYNTDIPGIPWASAQRDRFDDSRLPISEQRLDDDSLKSASEIKSIPDKIRGMFENSEDQDIAIVFVTAHGVTEYTSAAGGEQAGSAAYLLGTDFNYQNPSRRAPLDVLIGAMKDVPAQTKVLILDTSYMISDIRHGMGVNEFPFLLEQEVIDTDDPGLWVIHASCMLQPSYVSYSSDDPGSIFAKAVEHAFTMLSDNSRGKKNEEISLGRFYRQIAHGLWQFTPPSSGFAQTPVLMRGGVGFLDDKAQKEHLETADETTIFFRSVDMPKPKDDDGDSARLELRDAVIGVPAQAATWLAPVIGASHHLSSPSAWLGAPFRPMRGHRFLPQDDSNQDESADPSQDDGDGSGDGQDENSADGDDSDTSDETADTIAAPSSDLAADMIAQFEADLVGLTPFRQQMNQIHLLVDQITARQDQDGNPSAGWSPTDFAPDRWSKLLLRISRLDEQSRYFGVNSPTYDPRFRESQRIHQQLLALLDGLQADSSAIAPSGSVQGDEGPELINEWNRIVNDRRPTGARSWAINDPLAIQIIDAKRTYHDVLFRVKLYVLLHEELSAIIPTDLIAEINGLIDALNQHRDVLERQQFGDEDSGFARDATRMKVSADQLLVAERRVFRKLGSVLDLADQIKDDSDNSVVGQRILVIMLHSPLLPLFGPEGNDPDSRALAKISRSAIEIKLAQWMNEDEPRLRAKDDESVGVTSDEFYGGRNGDVWDRALQRLELRYRLLSLAVDTNQPVYQAAGEAIDDISVPRSFDRESTGELLESFGVATAQLNAVYELAMNEGEELQDRNIPNPRLRRIVAVSEFRDPRLFVQRDPNVLPLAFTYERAVERVNFVERQVTYPLIDRQRDVSVDLEISGYPRNTIEVEVVSMQPAGFDIQYEGQTIRQGTALDVPVDPDSSITSIPLVIIAQEGVDQANTPDGFDESEPYVVFKAVSRTAGAQEIPSQTRLRIVPPLPEFIDLIVQHRGTGVWEPSNQDGDATSGTDPSRPISVYPSTQAIPIVTVNPYSGHDSTFDLLLVNRSGTPVTATVDLFDVSRPRRSLQNGMPLPLLPGRVSEGLGHVPHRLMVPHMEDRIVPQGTQEPFASSLPIELPASPTVFPDEETTFGVDEAGGIAQQVLFNQPLPPDENGEAPPPPELPAGPFDVSNGILCRVTIDGWKANGEPTQYVRYKWIELWPAQPEKFLNVENPDSPVVTYDESAGRIKLALEANEGSLFPKGDAFPWAYFELIDQITWVVPDDVDLYPRRTPPQPTLLEENKGPALADWVFSGTTGPERFWDIYVDVDGYPRAISYSIDLGGGDSDGSYARDASDDLRIVRIVGLGSADDSDDGEPQELWSIKPSGTDTAWRGMCDHVRVDFQIDGPLGGLSELFERDVVLNEEEYIRIRTTVGGDLKHEEVFYFDREIEWKATIVNSGRLSIAQYVYDLSVTIPAIRLPPGNDIVVTAELFLGDGESPSTRTLFGLDTRIPRIVAERGIAFSDGQTETTIPLEDGVASVVLRALDEDAGIGATDVDFYLNPQWIDGAWNYDEAVKLKAPAMVRDGEWRLDVSVKDLNEVVGSFRIVPKIRDRVGLEANVGERQFVEINVRDIVAVVDPGGGGDMGDLPESYELRIELLSEYNRAVTDPDDWSLDGESVSPESIDDGKYIFALTDLEAGDHEIEVSYTNGASRKITKTYEFTIADDETDSILHRTIKFD